MTYQLISSYCTRNVPLFLLIYNVLIYIITILIFLIGKFFLYVYIYSITNFNLI